jgi:elongation factor G
MRAIYFDGKSGEIVREEDIPKDLLEEAKERREEMMDALTFFSDELAESYLSGVETTEQIYEAARRGTLSLKLTPVLMGSAYKNKGIQPLLDGVLRYLPSPAETENTAFDLDDDEKEVRLEPDPSRPTVALAFKLEASPPYTPQDKDKQTGPYALR